MKAEIMDEIERLRRARDFWFSAANRALRELEAVADDERWACHYCGIRGCADHGSTACPLPPPLPTPIEPIQHNVNSGMGKTTETIWKVIGRDDLNRENVSDFLHSENMTERDARDLAVRLNRCNLKDVWYYVAVPMSHKLYTWEP